MQPLSRRRPSAILTLATLTTLTTLTLTLAGSAAAAPEPFPARAISLVVPFPPGGPTDAMARTLASALHQQLGQSVIVENKAGAGGNIGAEHVARARPDGYTLLFGTSGPLAINASLYRKIGYDPRSSFAPVIHVGQLPNVLIVRPGLAATTLPELIALARANPGGISYASSGNGASSHLAGVLFNKIAATQLQHIPYKGTGPALNDLLAGQVDMAFTDLLTALPYIREGRVRALGLAGARTAPALPGVATLAQQGLAGYEVSVFFAVVAPAGTPPERIARLNQAFAQALHSAPLRSAFAAQGLEPASDSSAAYLQQFIAAETDKWKTLVQESGASLD